MSKTHFFVKYFDLRDREEYFVYDDSDEPSNDTTSSGLFGRIVRFKKGSFASRREPNGCMWMAERVSSRDGQARMEPVTEPTDVVEALKEIALGLRVPVKQTTKFGCELHALLALTKEYKVPLGYASLALTRARDAAAKQVEV